MNCEQIFTGHNIKCYDNGGRTADRYTVLYLDRRVNGGSRGPCEGVSMSATPFHPQGFGQHGDFVRGSHLGKVIRFKDLPEDCRKLVIQDLGGRWVSRLAVHVLGGVATSNNPLVHIIDHDNR